MAVIGEAVRIQGVEELDKLQEFSSLSGVRFATPEEIAAGYAEMSLLPREERWQPTLNELVPYIATEGNNGLTVSFFDLEEGRMAEIATLQRGQEFVIFSGSSPVEFYEVIDNSADAYTVCHKDADQTKRHTGDQKNIKVGQYVGMHIDTYAGLPERLIVNLGKSERDSIMLMNATAPSLRRSIGTDALSTRDIIEQMSADQRAEFLGKAVVLHVRRPVGSGYRIGAGEVIHDGSTRGRGPSSIAYFFPLEGRIFDRSLLTAMDGHSQFRRSV